MTDTDELLPELGTPDMIPPELASAWVAAWGELASVPKTKTANVEHRDGGRHSYQYADLSDMLDVVRPVLAKHGLALVQPVEREGRGMVVVSTWLLHSSGHLLRWTFEVSGEGSPQAIGSAITYGRRYCAQAALGIAADDDDDGQAAAQQAPRQTVTPPRQSGARTTTAHRPPAASPRERTMRAIFAVLGGQGIRDDDQRHALASEILGKPVASFGDLEMVELNRLHSELMRRARDAADEVDGRSEAWDAAEAAREAAPDAQDPY